MTPERRYRLLLLCYPRAYREERGEELLEVLLERTHGAGTWTVTGEAAALVRHGLAQRLRQAALHRPDPKAARLAGASLALLLAVLGARQLLDTALAGLGVDGYPDAWGTAVVWVDPRWPVHAAWLATGVALLLRRDRLTVLSAWSAATVHAWLLASTALRGLPWPGDAGPHWIASGGAAETSWLVLTVAAAVAIGGPGGLGRARSRLGDGRCWLATGAGLLGGGTVSVLAVLLAERSAAGLTPVGRGLAGPTPSVLLAAAVLVVGLLRVPQGRLALAVLGALGAVPLAVRWPEPTVLLGVAALVLLGGCAAAGLARASRPSPAA